MNLKDLPPFDGNIPRWINAAIRMSKENNLTLKKYPLPYVLREQGTGIKFLGDEVFTITVALTEAFCNTNATNIAHGITGFNRLINAEAFYDDNGTWFTLPYVDSSKSTDFKVGATNITSIVVGTITYTSWNSGYITLWYTKT